MIGLVLAAALHATPAQAATPPPAPPAAQQDAQEIFEKRCIACHGADGRGRTRKGRQFKAPDFTSAKWQRDTADEEIEDAITNGVPKSKMPAFKGKLSAAEIDSMIPFLRAFGVK